jgi:threonine dehydrogenase-like Zn-dependent dehydrogenase
MNCPDKDTDLKSRISAIYHEHKGRYGYRRITDELHNEGHLVNRKKVQRIMRELGLKCIVRMKKYRSYKGTVGKVSLDRLMVFGAISDKLSQFEFSHTALVQEYDFNLASRSFDVVVECTGGKFSESAVNQAIDVLRPGGCLILIGVTEERVPINTRDILEKGIMLMGSSRSSVTDYLPIIEAMKDTGYQHALRKLLPDQHTIVRSASDFTEAMEDAAAHRDWKKTMLAFEW